MFGRGEGEHEVGRKPRRVAADLAFEVFYFDAVETGEVGVQYYLLASHNENHRADRILIGDDFKSS